MPPNPRLEVAIAEGLKTEVQILIDSSFHLSGLVLFGVFQINNRLKMTVFRTVPPTSRAE